MTEEAGGSDMNGRIRSIKPEVLEDALAAKLSDSAWRLWVSSWVLSDDYGRFRAHDAYLAGHVWQDTTHAVAPFRDELVEKGFWRIYAVREQLYGMNLGWAKHQRVDNASKRLLPGPEDADTVVPDNRLPGVSVHLAESRGDLPRLAAGEEGKGKEGNGMDGRVREPNPTPTAAPPVLTNPTPNEPKPKKTRARAGLSFLPKDWMPEEKTVKELEKAGLSVESVVEDFRDYWHGTGKMMSDWNATFRMNIRNIRGKDWLMTKHRAMPKPNVPAKKKAEEPQGPAVAAPPQVGSMLRKFLGEEPGPSDPTPPAGSPTGETSTPRPEGGAKASAGST